MRSVYPFDYCRKCIYKVNCIIKRDDDEQYCEFYEEDEEREREANDYEIH